MSWNINGYNVLETVIELSIIWIIIFYAFRFLQGTRGGVVIRGLIVLLLPLWLLQMVPARIAQFDRLDFFADQFLTGLFLLLIIIFQPELRQAALTSQHPLCALSQVRQKAWQIHQQEEIAHLLS